MSTQVAGRVPEWTLGDRLRKARQVTGMTTRQFATEIGVAQGTVTGAENDTRQPRRITLLHNDGHTEHHPTGLVYDLAGLIRDLEVVN